MIMLYSFNWDQIPESMRYGKDPNAMVILNRGMSRSELDKDDHPIKSRAFRNGVQAALNQVVQLIESGNEHGLFKLTMDQTTDGHAQRNGIDTPFISARHGDVDVHSSKWGEDGVVATFHVPAKTIIVPWHMVNTPGREPSEVLLTGAIPKEAVLAVTPVSPVPSNNLTY